VSTSTRQPLTSPVEGTELPADRSGRRGIRCPRWPPRHLPPAKQAGAQHLVCVVFGQDETVKEKVEDDEFDAAGFELAMENYDGCRGNEAFPTREEAVECLKEYLS
jgi:hypothetical protein